MFYGFMSKWTMFSACIFSRLYLRVFYKIYIYVWFLELQSYIVNWTQFKYRIISKPKSLVSFGPIYSSDIISAIMY